MKRTTLYILTLSYTILCVVFSATAHADPNSLATIFSKQGTLELKSAGSSSWIAIDSGRSLTDNDTLRTASASRAALLFNDGLMVRLNENSLFTVKSKSNHTESLTLESGDAHFFNRETREFPQINTPLVSASIRGTEFTISSNQKESKITLIAGQVKAENKYGSLLINGGEQALVKPGQAPVKAIIINPLDATQWALYYPISIEKEDFSDLSSDKNISKALDYIAHSNSNDALKLLLKTNSKSSEFNLLLAALYLERGQLYRATQIHSTLRSETIKSSSKVILKSQQAIVALAKNQLSEAIRLANDAYTLNQNCITAILAQSFVKQAQYELKEALHVVDLGLNSYPENASLLSRRAELLLSFGDSKGALQSAEKVISRVPSHPQANKVAGFAKLARNDLKGAEQSFNVAIGSDSGDSLPYLGLGLVKIKLGDLVNGRRDIQKAADLDPSRSIYRSYLGKALFEEETDKLAEEEFERAIQLDQNDPTPYLYRAFERVANNRPVEALNDVEQSIALNDNRRVYRSRLLLDQDQSVRSNSLAEVYNILGFSEISRVEAIKSLGKDYSNYSAHLLLSESAGDAGDLIQQSLSEFFIARLLSPVSFNLIRPSQTAATSSNEYSAVFDRNIDRFAFDFIGNSRDHTYESHLLYSGTQDALGYAFDYSYEHSSGFRQNDFRHQHSAYGTVQYQLSPEDALLFDSGFTTFETGDTDIGLDPLTNNPAKELRLDDTFFRAGFNHKISAGNQLIGQIVYNHSNLRQHDQQFDRLLYAYIENSTDIISAQDISAIVDQCFGFKSSGTRADIQHIYNNHLISNVFGGGVLDSNQKFNESATVNLPEELSGIPIFSIADNTEASERLFNYTTYHATDWADIQAGVTLSHLHISGAPLIVPFSEETKSIDKLDPKLGVILSPYANTTVRAAYFESLGTAGIREFELIEPTVFSGFNQTFFDVYPGTKSRNFAIGLDQKFSTKTYLGLEASHRHTIRNFPITVTGVFIDVDSGELNNQAVFLNKFNAHGDEDSFKSYIYQVVAKQLTATIDYLWSQEQDHFYGTDIRTNKLQFGLNYFRPSGLLAFSRATWRTQARSGFQESSGDGVDGSKDFWIADVGVGYRFPHRHGQVTFTLNNIFDQDYKYIPTGQDGFILPGIGGTLSFSYNF